MCIYRDMKIILISISKSAARFVRGCLLNKNGEKNLWNLRFLCADKTEIESVIRTRAHTGMYTRHE